MLNYQRVLPSKSPFCWLNPIKPPLNHHFDIIYQSIYGDFPAKAGTPHKPGTSTARGTGAVSGEGAAVFREGTVFPYGNPGFLRIS